jgi:hypothetical protein
MTFFSKTNVVVHILQKLALFGTKTPIFCQLFWRKYLKIHNIGPSKRNGACCSGTPSTKMKP